MAPTPPPLSIYELSELKRENNEFHKAVTEAVSNLKEIGDSSSYERKLERAAGIHDVRYPIHKKAEWTMHEEYDRVISDLSAEVENLRVELEKKDKRASKQARSLDQLTKHLNTTTREIDARTRALTDAMDRIQELEAGVAEQTRVILTKETDLSKIHTELQDTRKHLREYVQLCGTLKQDKALLERELERERSLRKRSDKRAIEFEMKNKALDARCTELERSHTAIATSDAEHRKDMQLVAEQLQDTKEMLRRVQIEMSDRIARREAKISRLKMAVFDFTQERDLLRSRVDQLTDQLDSATSRAQSLEDKLNQCQSEVV
ncbi:hypothetical protein LEN26_002392 [Aphanomyces euteiches]|nr:hypothetical protein AeMF1_001537 [Aphanomyces euteiches]KAH9159333.1 hypothetical protein LEN26_002392 [Aphanomyces euteiches]